MKYTYNKLYNHGLEINEKIQSQFATRYENLVAISQILVAKLPCDCIGRNFEPW